MEFKSSEFAISEIAKFKFQWKFFVQIGYLHDANVLHFRVC